MSEQISESIIIWVVKFHQIPIMESFSENAPTHLSSKAFPGQSVQNALGLILPLSSYLPLSPQCSTETQKQNHEPSRWMS